jgi:hypothetical protein
MRHNGIRFHNHFRGDHWLRNAGWLAIYRPDLPMRATYGIGGAGHHRVVRGGRVSIGRRASGFVELKMINTVLWLILMAVAGAIAIELDQYRIRKLNRRPEYVRK